MEFQKSKWLQDVVIKLAFFFFFLSRCLQHMFRFLDYLNILFSRQKKSECVEGGG